MGRPVPFLTSTNAADFYSVAVGNLNATAPFTAAAVIQPDQNAGGIFGGLSGGDGFELALAAGPVASCTAGGATTAQTAVANLDALQKVMFIALSVPTSGNQTLYVNGITATTAVSLSAGGAAPRLLGAVSGTATVTLTAALMYDTTALSVASLNTVYSALRDNLAAGILQQVSNFDHIWLGFDNPTAQAATWTSRGQIGGLAATLTSPNGATNARALDEFSWY